MHTLFKLKICETECLEQEIVKQRGCRIKLATENPDDFEVFRVYGDEVSRYMPLCAEVSLLDNNGKAMVRDTARNGYPKDEILRRVQRNTMKADDKKLLRYEEPQFDVMFYPGLSIDLQSEDTVSCSVGERPKSLKIRFKGGEDEAERYIWEYVIDLGSREFVEPVFLREKNVN